MTWRPDKQFLEYLVKQFELELKDMNAPIIKIAGRYFSGNGLLAVIKKGNPIGRTIYKTLYDANEQNYLVSKE